MHAQTTKKETFVRCHSRCLSTIEEMMVTQGSPGPCREIRGVSILRDKKETRDAITVSYCSCDYIPCHEQIV